MINSTEKEFSSLYKNPVFATKEEDMYKHFDVIVDGMKVDVKGMKKINRQDSEVNPHFHYVEFMNVNGDKGWMYGEADVIAFEQPTCFILVNREKLLSFCREKIIDKKVGDKKEVYKLYRRSGRKDVMTIIPTEDLYKIKDDVVNKVG
jgi:predicted glutamine amidotransferase